MTPEKPQAKPNNPHFSSGPCAKRPGWSLSALNDALTGRSHRAAPCKGRLQEVIEKHRALLGIPADYKIGIVPASDTGAVEMALWSLLGARGIDVFAWESFGLDWMKDIQNHLKLQDVRNFEAGYGDLPDLTRADPGRDIVFAWNGTTSGVRVPDGDWINSNREGLTICDATSAVFAYDLPWQKLDVTTWSWQKVLGGEGAHGMIVLSPHAVERLETYTPAWPLPKIFRMTNKGRLNDGIFEGSTINTPSMLAVEDCLDALNWVESIGGLPATIKCTGDNFRAVEDWVNATGWVDFLAAKPETRSTTSICLKITDSWFTALDADTQAGVIKAMTKLLDSENAAKDIAGYRDAPAGLRIWGGATVATADIKALLPWLAYAYETVRADMHQKAA